eukprot:6198583-Pleurochrysis_carterae.AAC.1
MPQATTAASQLGGETVEPGNGIATDGDGIIKAPSTTASAASAAEADVSSSGASAVSADEAAARAGGLLSRRAKQEVVRMAAGATSNADEETVIAYEPPKPGEELCEARRATRQCDPPMRPTSAIRRCDTHRTRAARAAREGREGREGRTAQSTPAASDAPCVRYARRSISIESAATT